MAGERRKKWKKMPEKKKCGSSWHTASPDLFRSVVLFPLSRAKSVVCADFISLVSEYDLVAKEQDPRLLDLVTIFKAKPRAMRYLMTLHRFFTNFSYKKK